MNLLDYLTKETLEAARTVADRYPIRIYAPKDPMDQSRLADASPEFCQSFFEANSRRPEIRDLHELKATAEFIRGVPKIIRPSPEACRNMARVELNLTLADYAQPYESTGVVIPMVVSGLHKNVLAISHWRPGLGVFVGTHIGRQVLYQTIGPHWPGTLEEHLGVIDRYDEGLAIEDPQGLSRLFSRIALNACLFAVDRGVRLRPLDAREERCRRRVARDDRSAKFAARIAQEAIIQDLDLILLGGNVGIPGEPTGRRLRLHRRRGHWRMQAFGPGRSERKRIFVHSYMVHADDDPECEVQSILS